MDKVIKIFVLSVFLVIVGMLVAHTMRKSKEQQSIVVELRDEIDSLQKVRDTIQITKYETITKWRVRNEKEIRYIYLSDDSTQLLIRDSLRSRYNQGK